jgi:NAD(P)-dependent dehydrogenase (short-subunit alcohol dehydrogenase family)
MDKQQLEKLHSLDGRVAIVTGGSRGIGYAIAEGFALAGAKVVVTSRKLDSCEAAVKRIEAKGGEALAVATHMGEIDQLENLVKVTVERFGGIDILVNNAATALALPFGQITPEGWEKSFGVNLRGPVFLTQAALPYLEKSEHASIINVSSAGAYLFSTYTHMYSAAKAALLAYTRSMAAEFAQRGIRVNAIAPGTIDTDMVRNNPPERQEQLALYLASDASSFVTGTTINIDGGLVPR